jgi:hypothetical protein
MKYLPISWLLAALTLTGCLEKILPGASDETEESAEEGAAGTSELYQEKLALAKQLKQLQAASKIDLAKEELTKVSEMEEVRAYYESVVSTKAALQTSLSQWRAATRDSFVGVKLPQIQLISGETYSDVTLTAVEDQVVRITHSGGEATLEIMKLPIGLRKNVIHEPTVLTERAVAQ